MYVHTLSFCISWVVDDVHNALFVLSVILHQFLTIEIDLRLFIIMIKYTKQKKECLFFNILDIFLKHTLLHTFLGIRFLLLHQKTTCIKKQKLIVFISIYHKDRYHRFNVPIKGLCTTKTHGSES